MYKIRGETKEQRGKKIVNYKMDVEEDDDKKIKYTYIMSKGISKVQGAINIFEKMGYPKEIIDSFRMN